MESASSKDQLLYSKLVKPTYIFLFLCLFESLILLFVLFRISTSPENAWFLGYSKPRWILFGAILFSGIFFLSCILVISKRSIRGYIKAFFSYINRLYIFLGSSLLLISILLFLIRFHVYFNTSYAVSDAIYGRIFPILLFGEVLCFQLIIFLIFLHFSFPNPTIYKLGESLHKLLLIVDNWIELVSNKLNRTLIIVILISSPTILTVALVFLFFGTSITNYVPIGSDEINYWREMSTYRAVGFQGGQYSTNELVAQVKFTHFGSHGPAFALIYGTFGKLINWDYYSGILLNLLFFTLAIIIFILLLKLSNKQLLLFLLLIITYWPIWIYLPTTRVESFLMALSVIIAVLFIKMINSEGQLNVIAISLFLFIIISSLVRISTAYLLFPYFVFLSIDKKLKWKILAAFLAVIIFGLVFIYFQLFTSPYPELFYTLVYSIKGSIFSNWMQLAPKIFSNIKTNIASFFSIKDFPIRALFHFQLLWFLIVVIVDFINWIKNPKRSLNNIENKITSLHIANLGILFVIYIIVEEVKLGRDYRTFAAHFLLSLILLIFSNRRRLILGIIISNLLFTFQFGSHFRTSSQPSFSVDRSIMAEFQDSISNYVAYQSGKNHWCNTVDVSRYSYTNLWRYPILTFPDGFGITSIIDWREFETLDLKAKYVLLEPDYMEDTYPAVFNKLNLKLLSETPLGNLYINLDSDC